MRHNYHSDADLPRQFRQLFITLFDLFVERLILDFELFKVNQVEPVSQLFFFLQNFLAIGQLIPQLNVLQAVLVHF